MNTAASPESVRFQPDWSHYPAVVVESDDWGACETASTHAQWRKLQSAELLRDSPFAAATLEYANTMNRLQSLLQAYRGPDGQSAVITAFACLANPDYNKIEKGGFQHYHDIPIDRGFPSKWRRPGLASAWASAMHAGVFHPEFHTRLHHTHPGVWLQHLRDGDKRARALFKQQVYVQGSHIPEYQGMNPACQHRWVEQAVETFIRWTGYRPSAGVTSDATPVTEIIWRAHGIRTFCLRNFRNERGEVIVYPSKPWNNQNPYTPMGGWNPQSDTVYLRRNVDFECGWKVPETAAVVDQIKRQWDSNEPAVLNMHRVNLVCFNKSLQERGWQNFEALLQAMQSMGNVRFLTSSEAGDIYRQGWSARKTGDRLLLRVLGPAEGRLNLNREPLDIEALTGGKVRGSLTTGSWCFKATRGDYLLKLARADQANVAITDTDC